MATLTVRLPVPTCLLCDCQKIMPGNMVDMRLDQTKWPDSEEIRGAVLTVEDPAAGDPVDTQMAIEVEYNDADLPAGISAIEPQDVEYVDCVDITINNKERIETLEEKVLGTNETIAGNGPPDKKPSEYDIGSDDDDLVLYLDKDADNLYYWNGTEWTTGTLYMWRPSDGYPATRGFHLVLETGSLGGVDWYKDDIAIVTDLKMYRVGQEGMLGSNYMNLTKPQIVSGQKTFESLQVYLDNTFCIRDRTTGHCVNFLPITAGNYEGTVGLIVPKASGVIALTPNEDGTIASESVSDATSDGYSNPGKLLKAADSTGHLTVSGFKATSIAVYDTQSNSEASLEVFGLLSNDRSISMPDGSGTIALTSNADGSITSGNVSDATSDGAANPEKVLKTNSSGLVKVTTIDASGHQFGDDGTLSGPGDSSLQLWSLPSASGTVALKAAAQADSTAADVAELVSDFNALLAKLRASGVIATS